MNEYFKEYYKSNKEKWGDFEAEYYQLLNTIDNLKSIILRKYTDFSKAERALKYNRGELRRRFDYLFITPNLKGLKRLCKGLNISYHYAIFGGEEEPYKDFEITFNNFKRLYREKYTERRNPIIASLLVCIKNKKTSSIPLKYLIRMSKEHRVTIDWLLGG